MSKKDDKKTLSEKELDKIVGGLTTMQVDYKTEKKIVKDYFDTQSIAKVSEIATNKDMKNSRGKKRIWLKLA